MKWMAAIPKEIRSFEENDTWELVDSLEANTIVECYVLKTNCDSENARRHRARLVAKGYSQRWGVDYYELFALVVRHQTLRILGASAKFRVENNSIRCKNCILEWNSKRKCVNSITSDIESFIEELLNKFNMLDYKTVSIPW